MEINDFKAKLQGGGVRNNLFRVILPFPTFAIIGGETEEMAFLCKAAQIPSSTMGIIEVPFRGRQLKISGDRTFEEWTVTVLNDTDHLIRNAFERWSNGINQHQANVGLENPTDYQVNGLVEQLDRSGDVLKTYEMIGLWPSEVASVELSYDSTDELQEFTVTMQVQWWNSNTTT